MPRPGFSLKWFLFSFKGRIGRLAYWIFTLISLSVLAVLTLGGGWITSAVAEKPETADFVTDSPAQLIFVAYMAVVIVIYLWTNYAVHAKRWHDRNKSGWWSLIGLVPYIGSFWIIVECGFLRGTEGPNRFGGDPNPAGVATVFE